MSDDEPQHGGLGESSEREVKSKVEQLSGLRMKQKRVRKRVDAARARAPKGKTESPAEQAKKPGKDSKAAARTGRSPSELSVTELIPELAGPPPPTETPKTATPKPPRSIRPSVAFVIGLAGGCIPAIAFVLMAVLTAETPEGIPAGAVERQHDWIHCPKSVANQRWRCEVYASSGKLASTGEFVHATAATPTNADWQSLASSGALVPDGWHDAKLAREKTLHVRGVKVSSVSTRGQR